LQFGEITVAVEILVAPAPAAATAAPSPSDNLLVTATAQGGLNESLSELAQDCPRGMPAREPLLACSAPVTTSCISKKKRSYCPRSCTRRSPSSDAQRGAIVLAGGEGTLVLRR